MYTSWISSNHQIKFMRIGQNWCTLHRSIWTTLCIVFHRSRNDGLLQASNNKKLVMKTQSNKQQKSSSPMLLLWLPTMKPNHGTIACPCMEYKICIVILIDTHNDLLSTDIFKSLHAHTYINMLSDTYLVHSMRHHRPYTQQVIDKTAFELDLLGAIFKNLLYRVSQKKLYTCITLNFRSLLSIYANFRNIYAKADSTAF